MIDKYQLLTRGLNRILWQGAPLESNPTFKTIFAFFFLFSLLCFLFTLGAFSSLFLLLIASLCIPGVDPLSITVCHLTEGSSSFPQNVRIQNLGIPFWEMLLSKTPKYPFEKCCYPKSKIPFREMLLFKI